MKIIGVTGGVGAGKSEVLSYIEKTYGAKTIRLDDVARDLQEPGGLLHPAMIMLCGRDKVLPDGRLDRPAIARMIYEDPTLRHRINGLVHPAVKNKTRKLLDQFNAEGCPYVFIEAALLIEDHYDEICDELWYIYADKAVRRERLKASRGYDDKKITAIMHSQAGDMTFRAHADVVIDNSGAFEETARQIDKRLIIT
ncbi:MAG: dephospho-CoA kinase [Lachnospiraceae bacterium]|nr:dephospho-CoA kinase [Lachnospiraceae bacterium]